jgi:hypothetical protein
MLILIAGPYRSGTGDDPEKMAANLKRLEAPSHALFQAGHVPMIGEWVALPIWHAAGGRSVGDALGDDLAVTAQDVENEGLALRCQHRFSARN